MKKLIQCQIDFWEEAFYVGLPILIALALFATAVFGAARGSGSNTTQCVGSPCEYLYLPAAREEPGYFTGASSSVNRNMLIISSAINRIEFQAGNTNYIQLRNTLQSGATFYVSSASVSGKLEIQGNISRDRYSLIVGTGAKSISGEDVYHLAITTNGRVIIGSGTVPDTFDLFEVVAQVGYDGSYTAEFVNKNRSPRASNGVLINAGDSASDVSFIVRNSSNALEYLSISGTGTVAMAASGVGKVNIGTGNGSELFNITSGSMNFTGANGRITYNSADGLGRACSKWIPVAPSRILSSNVATNQLSDWTNLYVPGVSTNSKQVLLDVAINQRLGTGAIAFNICELSFRRDPGVVASTAAMVYVRNDPDNANAHSDTAQRMVMVSTATLQFRTNQQGAAGPVCDYFVDINQYCE